jgi:PAS domain S-box-containing protein
MYLSFQISIRKIQKTKREYIELFKINPAPMFIFEIQSFKFLSVNEAAIQKFGFSHEELLHMTVLDLRPPEDVERVKNIILNDPHEGLSDKGIWKYKRKDGKYIWVNVFSHTTTFEGKNARLILAYDVNERYLAEEKITKQNKKLLDIAWFQSHRLRAPIASILGLTSVINYKDPADKDNLEVMKKLQVSAGELDNLVKEIIRKSMEVDDLTGHNKN